MKLQFKILFICLFIASCTTEEEFVQIDNLPIMEVPPNFPEIEHPEGNEFTLDRWKLGKKLFYDPILSKDGSISCASCHESTIAFADNMDVSIGAFGLLGTRNAPSLANVAFHPYYTREGGIPTLEMQILVPIQEHNEFNNNIVLIADTLSQIPEYVQMANIAYSQEPNSFVITRALAQFERSIISGQSLYDLEYNYNQVGSMSLPAKKGEALFNSERLSCNTCHSGFNFTDYSFQNNGLYEDYDDVGRARLTQDNNDIGLFKVPSLRNIEITQPYMHDGSFSTLEEVIDHYNTGGQNHINKNNIVRPLNLTNTEKNDLKAFLESLTDNNLLTNKNLSNE